MNLNGNERAAIIGQLVAMRNVLDGVLASLQEDAAQVCAHPGEQRKYAKGTMGGIVRFTCQRCGEDVEEQSDSLSRSARPTEGA